jgi:hypothetical protein
LSRDFRRSIDDFWFHFTRFLHDVFDFRDDHFLGGGFRRI